MKRALWGYQVREVDDAMEVLMNHNTSLTQQNGQLEADLKELKERLDGVQTAEEEKNSTCQRMEQEKRSLEKKLEQEKAETERWKAEAEKWQEEAQKWKQEAEASREQTAADADSKMNEISEICRMAYADILAARRSSREKMEQTIEEFAEKWSAAQRQMDAAVEQLGSSRARARERFIEMADDVLSSFDKLEKISAVLYSGTEEISARGAEMKAQMEALVSPLLAEPEEEKKAPAAVIQEEEPKAADGETEEAAEPEGEAEAEAAATVSPIIEAIQQRRKQVI